jgi:hypothetical protein
MKRLVSCVLVVLFQPVAAVFGQIPVVAGDGFPPVLPPSGGASGAQAPVVDPPPLSTTLPVVEALRPDLEPLDPFAPRPNGMARRWRYDPSPEEITLKHNGYLMYYGIKGVLAAGRWLNTATGGPAQIQHAEARDLPLDDEQIARAARWSASQE